MAPKEEDKIPESYKYFWTNDSALSLQEFLQKYQPTMVQNDGTKPWIWVKASEAKKDDTGQDEAVAEASQVLQELTAKVEDIKNDGSIPIRSNKKTGAKSKKEVREAAQAEATKKLEEISVKHGFVSGKWLVFAPAEKVNLIWSTIATSLVSGPLSSTCAHTAKVATSPQVESPNYQHIICIYVPDVYNKPKVLEVMKVLLRNHGLNLSGVKSNLYTHLGIDSKHPSGLQSTVWKNSALMSDAEMKEMKDTYFAELANKTFEGVDEPKTVEKADAGEGGQAKPKPKPRLKKKGKLDFVSSGDEEGEKKPEYSKAKPKPKLKKVGKDTDPFVYSEDEASSPKPQAPVRKRAESSSKDGDERQGKAKRAKV